MKNKIYIVTAHRANLSNLFLALSLIGNSFFEPCVPYLENNQFIRFRLGKFAHSLEKICQTELRLIDVSNAVTYLDDTLNNNSCIFGTYNYANLDFLKNQYHNQVVTISINYQANIYTKLLRNIAQEHVHRIAQQIINPADVDQRVAELSRDEQIDYYINAFDNLNLLPKQFSKDADYQLNLEDFFEFDKMVAHFKNLELDIVPSSYVFYNSWLNHNKEC